MQAEANKGNQDGHLGTWAPKGHQQSSAVISSHQRSSAVIRGNQRQSEAITFAVTDLGSTVDTMRQKKGRKLGALRMTAFRKDDG
jgi:hypothetical protein